jgi:protein-S-isoprenylcysteine O-methyltransferase Ste14
MNNGTWVFIQACWIAWLVYWVAMAFATKRTAERGGFFGYRLVAGILILGLVFAGRLLHVSSHSELWHTSLALGIATDLLVLAGLAFTVWARVVLGRNWSAEIYTGLIAMALGTAINYGRPLGFAIFAALCAALWWKAREEERMMSEHFPAEYAGYRVRVHAIIPFVL